jgi:cell division topological specificity factor
MMAGFWERMLGRGGKGSGATAKERLQFVLFHDRINLSPEKLEMMKKEILAVISKYVDIDEDRVDIALQQGDRRGSMLVAEIPFIKAAEGVEKDDDAQPSSFELRVEIMEKPSEDAATETADNLLDAPADEQVIEDTSDENDKTQPHKS